MEQTAQRRKLKSWVIAVGVINMTTGETAHEWSIYESQGLHAFLTNNGFLLLGVKDTFQKDDVVLMLSNDTQRKLKDNVIVIDSASCNNEELLDMLEKHRYYYKPLKAFRSRPQGARKLSTSYSVKGTDFA